MEAISFKTEVFEGPLDLLLHLISKNKLNILDVSLAQITNQYFEYIEAWKNLDMDFSSDFLVIASELLYIKSKLILPVIEEETADEEDSASKLVERLKEYKLFKLCADSLDDRQFESKYLFFKLAEQIKFPAKPMKDMQDSALIEALYTLSARKAIEVLPGKDLFKDVIAKKPISIFSKVKDILKKIKHKAKVKYNELFTGTKSERIASFLAVLELMKLNRIKMTDDDEIIISEDGR
ncbi:MAG: segregation/condensation protein A [Bacillota bacterium]|nr:segregation/condensation protein A [Bacillota bacterium]